MQLTPKQKGVISVFAFLAILLLPASWALLREFRLGRKAAPKEKQAPPKFTYKIICHDSTEAGYLLLGPSASKTGNTGNLVIMDFAGDIIWQKPVDGVVYDFRQWAINGATRYSYFVNDRKAMHMKGLGVCAGYYSIMDSAMNEIRQLHLLPYGNVSISEHQDLDPHDIILLSDDHYYALASYEKKVSNIPASLHPSPTIKVAAPIIQEVQNGQVIWQWDASEHPEFYTASATKNNFGDTALTQDYLHVNALSLDPADSNLIVSFRNAGQVVKIDRRTGNILWRFGGKTSDFALEPQQAFLRQHHARLTDSRTMLMLDNGDSVARPHSRVLEFGFDEQKKKVTAFKSFDIPEEFAQTMGSVTKLGDDYLICGGSTGYVLQVNSITGKKKFELLDSMVMYRAYKVDRLPGLVNKK